MRCPNHIIKSNIKIFITYIRSVTLARFLGGPYVELGLLSFLALVATLFLLTIGCSNIRDWYISSLLLNDNVFPLQIKSFIVLYNLWCEIKHITTWILDDNALSNVGSSNFSPYRFLQNLVTNKSSSTHLWCWGAAGATRFAHLLTFSTFRLQAKQLLILCLRESTQETVYYN